MEEFLVGFVVLAEFLVTGNGFVPEFSGIVDSNNEIMPCLLDF